MRILFITETVPYPLDSGGRIKTWHTLQVLSRRHEVHVHAFIRDTREREAEHALRERVASTTLHLLPAGIVRELRGLARSVSARLPFTVARHWSREAARAIADAARRQVPDAVYADHLSMLQYAIPLGRPIVHDAHNVEYEIVRRYAASADPARRAFAEVEWRRLRAYERRAYDACDVVTVVSTRDAAHIRDLGVTAPSVHVVPIAFDGAAQPTASTPEAAPAPPVVLFVGGLHWPPNAQGVSWYVEQVWPRVVAAHPTAELVVVGRASHAQRRLLERTTRVRVVGYVDDVAPWFERARVFVSPLLSGGGMRVKILEAFARGTPVVSTAVGAEGIDAEDAETWATADDPPAFAAAVLRVLGDDGVAQAMRERGRRVVASTYSVDAVGARLDAALASLAPRLTRGGQ